MDSNGQTNGNMEDNLEKGVPDVSFEGVKLSIDSNNLLDENNTGGIQGEGAATPVDNAKFQPNAVNSSGFYFASQAGRLEAAATACQNNLINQEEDGNLLGVWLLTEVDHWDNEKERVAAVTDNSLYLVKFDFIVNQIKTYRRVMFNTLSALQKGNFTYPEKTLAPARTGEGVRLHWSSGRPLSVLEKWNPFSDTIPYTTLTSHPLQTDNTRQAQNYQVGPFYNTLQQAVTTSRSAHHPNLPPVSLTAAPIELEIYLGLSSMVYNQSKLGFFRERGGVSF
ncbi:tumor protein p63-regulated gene 1-like protein [Strongylocentrotus purpuratus]|uniref:HSac2 domain-containing protein n=1 Tax=Strongylocentrotus purpuratus TaxID=7668 RepID=A0A7M7NXU6_STRPU|nr:tumor protein p63-regulated gene 1-like protein [Strongylocentrotus purpuratus]XP_030843188.1 tumor protein p63-regulated gene 1-like protein [Strongylocentrotus purpuratus]